MTPQRLVLIDGSAKDAAAVAVLRDYPEGVTFSVLRADALATLAEFPGMAAVAEQNVSPAQGKPGCQNWWRYCWFKPGGFPEDQAADCLYERRRRAEEQARLERMRKGRKSG